MRANSLSRTMLPVMLAALIGLPAFGAGRDQANRWQNVIVGRQTARTPEGSPAHVRRGGGLKLDVAPDLSTFDAVREAEPGDATPTGPFYVAGSIYPPGTLDPDGAVPEGAAPIGTFRCWGWLFDGSAGLAVVSQAFELDGAGEIQVQGVEDDRRAVTGGTGRFRNVRGEGRFEVLNPENLAFRAVFHLVGAGE